MSSTLTKIYPLKYTGNSLKVLDQRKLPAEEIYVECSTYNEVIQAIQNMLVRGAPAIGFAGAWACCLAVKAVDDKRDLLRIFHEIELARPTAVNLSKAIRRMEKCLIEKGAGSLENEAEAIYKEDIEMCNIMASHGLTVLPNKSEFTLLTHCNTGSLATAGIGTALGVIKFLVQQNKKVHVYATETRPYLQGARLTAWELQKCGIQVSVLPDSAVTYLMKTAKIDAVYVGADRIVSNGDTANKVGTYMIALAAQREKVPFYVVAPSTSFDLNLQSGEEIEIEQRSSKELSEFNNKQICPSGIDFYNPAFDITPSELISGYITEKGVLNVSKFKYNF
ncbi:MAG: S-methyl-5-thioribose-1-phosphate isomerase [Candidatus Caenarcaniphilales bacterium]|nr:S-methyl-5-thioribose-1-phosphate isomerase [Candidatus Caenarcaniphilales bacterium]